jgi:2-polyprenyl-6-methoxyphenol hydroxylase-like FAD-dependent oxidoreductase
METTAFGRIVLIGDAGHGVQPCLGTGCGLALMDGAVLGRVLGELAEDGTEPISDALQKFSAERAKPTTEAIMASRGASINFRRLSANDKTTFG